MAFIETRFIAANGIVQHVRMTGRADAPAVMLIHGLGWDGTLWQRELTTLAAAGWRAVAPDLRGMGRSDKPDAPSSIPLYAADLVALADALAIARFAVVGFSLGGTIALAMAEAAPTRLTAAICACAAVVESAAGAAATEAMLARAATLGAQRFAEEQAQAIWSPSWAGDHREEVARFVAWRAAMDQAALARAFRSSRGFDLRPALARLSLPIRIIAADGDSFVGVEACRALAATLPDADFVAIADAGHMASLEQPAAFQAALLGFLERAWPPEPAGAARAEA